MQATADDAPDMPLGAIPFAGRRLAERQLDLALALGCERVVCVAGGIDSQVLALQHRVEGAGAQFNVISGAAPLLALVHANDELIAIADGLLLAPDAANNALAGGPGVLVLPVETGMAAGFERIDLNHAWAGVLAMPGRLVERLAELPPDCDPIEGLLRIALQGRVPKRVLPEALLAEDRWAPVRARHQAAELEPAWFRRHAAAPDWHAPGRALARLAVRRFGGRLLERRLRPELLAALGAILSGAGAVCAWFWSSVPALALLAGGALCVEGATAFAALARGGMGQQMRLGKFDNAPAWCVDVALVVILALAMPGAWLERLFAPLVLVGLLRLAAGMVSPRWAELSEDRATLAVLLAVASAFGLPFPAVAGLALGLLALLLFGLARGSARLTQT